MGTVNQSNEAIRCEYISAILHACVHITKNLTGKYIRINPQFEIIGGESTGRVDYAIGALEELFCITEGKQFQIDIGFAQVGMNSVCMFRVKSYFANEFVYRILCNAKVPTEQIKENKKRMMLFTTISSGL